MDFLNNKEVQMAKRKFLNLSALIDGDPVGLPVPPLPPIVKLWAYRMLVELGQAQSILASGTYRQDGLLRQLGLGHLLSQEDEDQRNRSVMKAMLQMHAEAEQAPSEVPPVLVRKVSSAWPRAST